MKIKELKKYYEDLIIFAFGNNDEERRQLREEIIDVD